MRLPISIRRIVQGIALVAALLPTLAACDSVLDNDYGDCEVTYHVRFKYDYNMEFVDAFAPQVKSVSLYAFAADGTLTHSVAAPVSQLATQGNTMQVDFDPSQYRLVAWGDLDVQGATFSVPLMQPGNGLLDDMQCTMQRSRQADGQATVTELTALYHAALDRPALVVENDDELNPVVEMPLMKNTNTLRVILQNLSQEPIGPDDFHFCITDENGLMNHDNTLLTDETLTYLPFYKGQGSVDYNRSSRASSDNSTQLNVAIAEFCFGRIMDGGEARLTITNQATGKPVLSIPLAQYLALVKSHYNRQMSNQEYFDRQDEYSLTFFLDEQGNWLAASILVNGWRVVLSDVEID
ncbi:MAG: FimB/Mfa2 family fimbrial subunit [Bacteroides sp.]|nr:FimB/Mfa2 family fimbrial subunit [Bacteroides sp.]